MFSLDLPFFFLLIFSTSTTTARPYVPADKLFIDCGSKSHVNQGWATDYKIRFLPSNESTTSFSSTLAHLESSVPLVPYSTARLFNTSSFTYTFPLSQGPKFLRLHFYPATYSGLNTQQSFFSVSSNGYSLLTNFSAFLAASFLAKTRSARVSYFVKEFLIHVKDTYALDVTFTPSPNSYAFINGIEILSMPAYLYFNAKSLNYNGMIKRHVLDNNMALENIYRLNIGGGQILVKNDTGMYRSWDQDSDYIYGAENGLTNCYHSPIMYTKETPSYTAPELVYQTQRSIGNQSDKYNLTWILPVDSGFYYLLRLHFCNIIPQYTKQGDVKFGIFVNNQIADVADLFDWTQGSGYPVFKDYIVFIDDPDGRRSKQDLWLSMQPSPFSELYLDAYLNGFEAFKLSMN